MAIILPKYQYDRELAILQAKADKAGVFDFSLAGKQLEFFKANYTYEDVNKQVTAEQQAINRAATDKVQNTTDKTLGDALAAHVKKRNEEIAAEEAAQSQVNSSSSDIPVVAAPISSPTITPVTWEQQQAQANNIAGKQVASAAYDTPLVAAPISGPTPVTYEQQQAAQENLARGKVVELSSDNSQESLRKSEVAANASTNSAQETFRQSKKAAEKEAVSEITSKAATAPYSGGGEFKTLTSFKAPQGNLKTNPADFFEATSIGSIERAVGASMFGLNMNNAPVAANNNTDTFGYIFFTRPQLNLQTSNVSNIRKLYSLLTSKDTSMQRQIRALLDPRLQRSLATTASALINNELLDLVGYSRTPLVAPFVDTKNCFIPLLTNACTNVSGFPDITAETFTSKPGLHKESYVQYDDSARTSHPVDIECTFRNLIGDPITYMFFVWVNYGTLAYEGMLMPYIDYIAQNWIDSNTRIWRLVMDQDKKIVRKIAATGPAIPISIPLGSFFDYNNESPYNLQNKDINIRFRCMGVEYMDDILVKEFNDTTIIFNEDLMDGPRQAKYVRVSSVYRTILNHMCYPRINIETYELEWWTPIEVFNEVTSRYADAGIASYSNI